MIHASVWEIVGASSATRIDQSDRYRRNSAVFKNFVLYSPDPPSAFTEGLGTRLNYPVPVHEYWTGYPVKYSPPVATCIQARQIE